MWLIGSRALVEHVKLRRPVADIDLMTTPQELEQLKSQATRAVESENHPGKWALTIDGYKVEVDSTSNKSRLMLSYDSWSSLSHMMELPFKIETLAQVPTLSTLWCFKRSHAGYPIYPDKTLADLILMSRELLGRELKETDYTTFLTGFEIELLAALRAEVKERFARRDRRMTFNRPAKDFFKSAQNMRTFDHDSLHDATYRWDSPLYRDNLVDPTKALVDMDLFMSRPLEYRLTMAQEEAIVIGLERYYLNSPDMSDREVYRRGMTKFATDLCKGRFQDFILDHLHLMTVPMWDFMTKFNQARDSGQLKVIESVKADVG